MMGQWFGTTFTGSWWGRAIRAFVRRIQQTFVRVFPQETVLKSIANETTVTKRAR